MTHRIILVLLTAYLCSGCNSSGAIKSRNNSVNPIQIHRFDKDLFHRITSDTSGLDTSFMEAYAPVLKVIGLSLFNRQDIQTVDFQNRLLNYYAEPALYELYQDALRKYDNIESLEKALSQGFAYLHTAFPYMQIPAVYMHVSGFGQNLLADDSLLSISVDKYLGADYPLYEDFFYPYQRQKMNPENIVSDYLTAWLLSEYPFTGNDRVLLERMIYEGKIKYIVDQALPSKTPHTLMGYAPEAYKWCKQHEKELWRAIIEHKHLYTPDYVTTSKYFSDRPATFISDAAPGNLGSWIGWQIVSKYMAKTKTSVLELMNNTDFQDILVKSKYKP